MKPGSCWSSCWETILCALFCNAACFGASLRDQGHVSFPDDLIQIQLFNLPTCVLDPAQNISLSQSSAQWSFPGVAMPRPMQRLHILSRELRHGRAHQMQHSAQATIKAYQEQGTEVLSSMGSLLGSPVLGYDGVDLDKVPHLVVRPEKLHAST